MSFGSRFGKLGQWWADKSRLEKILMVFVFISVVLIIIFLFRPHSQSLESGCKTRACLKASMRILEQVNVSFNPCEDIYNFACKKELDDIETINVEALGEELLYDAYKEPIRDYEHKMVKAAKRLYQTCLDEEQIERDGLKTIKEVLKALGGWPVVEGPGWDEASFDWLKASYKARELGYYYSAFLDITVKADPNDLEKQILEVSLANFRYHLYSSDKVELMREVAILFGADKNIDIISELENVREFQQKHEKISNPFYLISRLDDVVFSIDDYQQRCRSIDWLQFINNIIGQSNQISKNQLVLFPPPQKLSNWLNILSNTPKRTLANYMMWEIVADTIPYLMKSLETDDKDRFIKSEFRNQFCLEQARTRFFPDPVNIMVARKHVPESKNQLIAKLMVDVKTELIELISKINWINDSDKQRILNRTKALQFIIAHPGEYWKDQILDSIDVDMIEVKTVNFLNLLAQATRNCETMTFSQIKKPFFDDLTRGWYSWASTYSPSYSVDINALFVPIVAAGSSFFDQNRPQYLNYGTVGSIVGYYLSETVASLQHLIEPNGWSNKTKEAFQEKQQCLKKHVDNGYELVQISVVQKIVYGAYDKWTKKYGEELKLLGVDYTPRQLFWISSANSFCQTRAQSPFSWKYYISPEMNVSTFSTFSSYNRNFAKDLNCPENPKPNPLEICHIF